MTPQLTKQQRRVFDYIRAHRGCTTKDIQQGIGIECPSGRITEIRQALEGSALSLVSVGKRKYPGTRAFECYAIQGGEPAHKLEYQYDRDRGVMVQVKVLL